MSMDKTEENHATKMGKASDTKYYSGLQAQESQILCKKLKFAQVIVTKPSGTTDLHIAPTVAATTHTGNSTQLYS
jgi:hypothetical protein